MESGTAPRSEVEQSAPESRGRGVRRLLLGALGLALLVGVVVAVELGSPRRIDPTGVDEVPGSPSSFVARVDHPWLPLTPGRVWTYEGEVDSVSATMTVTVLDDAVEVDGVAATGVRTVVERDGEQESTTAWFGQDRDGTLWLLGREGVWEAADGGTPPGLVLPAEPRRGDAQLVQPLDGDDRWVLEVGESVDDGVAVPAGRYDVGLELLLRRGAERAEEEVTDLTLVRGVGVVRVVGPDVRLELVSSRP
ncbi:hypothetical protein [Nocardioides daphniae]|uniref:DUF2993 domain-containing protein n=1 Tax=Nocardioides daphniae TaxID=402297 RepID=A0ABQ1QER0_9ACTN|nr:hypothetical protein [Nocardioides daphniae]GGD23882.1 hypothetical protein GCM10007231_23740 [Nocardioides daphniae]